MDPNRTIQPKPLLAVLRGALDRRIKQRARDTIVRNAVEDPAKPYAQRVVEEDACDFCKQLGTSRPVKPSQIASRYHQYCKCHVALFFQETRFKERFTNRGQLEKLGIEVEEGAVHDDYDNRVAITLTSLGKRVRFLAEAQDGTRRADSLVDGVLIEFKNPVYRDMQTVERSVHHVLYGRNQKVIKPQSDRMLVSNAANGMTMSAMQESLAYVLRGESRLTEHELSYIKEISLLDVNTGRVRTYVLRS